jgi:uncharacterized phage infection (PIP) family protein YhgE
MTEKNSEEAAIQKAEEDRLPTLTHAVGLKIENEADLETSKEYRKNILELKKQVGESFDPIVDAAHQTHKKAVAKRFEQLDPLEKATKLLKGKEADYYTEIERQEEKARQERERLAAEERKRIETRINRLLKDTGKISDNIAILETELEKTETTDQEADIIQAQLTVLRSRLAQKNTTIDTKVQEVENVDSIPETRTRLPAYRGKMERIPTVINKKALLQSAAKGLVPINVFDENMGNLKKYVNLGDDIRPAGVRIDDKRVVR